MNDILANIIIQPKVLTPEACDFLINHAKKSNQEQMGVFDAERANETGENHPGKIDLSSRNVKCADILPILPQIKELYDNIANAKLKFPKVVSEKARSLLEGLLRKNPKQRLGCKGFD